MKKILLLVLICNSVFAQNKHSETNFFSDNNQVYWMRIYENSNLQREDLMLHFQKEVVTNMKLDNFQVFDNTISFTVLDDKVDFRKYGGTAMGTAFIAQMYMTYLVVIDFKDYRYKVTAKEIFLDNKATGAGSMKGDLSEFILRKRTNEFVNSKIITKGLKFDDLHFTEKFSIKATKQNDW